MTETSPRTPGHDIDPLFITRWSPRAFDASPLAEDALMRLFEAARWAPSAFNAQPWRFVYALRDGGDWDRLLDTLIPFNQSWAKSASALVFIVSDRFLRKPDGTANGDSYSHSFDAGAAWAQLSLQAAREGLHVHAMSGFDGGRARSAMALPEDFHIEAAIAVGRLGDPATLSEGLRAKESPSGRRPLDETAFAGRFPS